MIVLIIYVVVVLISFRIFSIYVIEERDSESTSILIVMSAAWPFVYLVFMVLGIRNLIRRMR